MVRRREFDRYATPSKATEALIARWPEIVKNTVIIEPCAGVGDIACVLGRAWGAQGEFRPTVITNDIDRLMSCDYALDARDDQAWQRFFPAVDWVVSNPPFDQALGIIEQSLLYARVGVAMLLRLTFFEPTTEGSASKTLRGDADVPLPGFETAVRVLPANRPRAEFWMAHPATACIPMSRISFTNDGNTDSVTTGWVIWKRGAEPAIYPTVI